MSFAKIIHICICPSEKYLLHSNHGFISLSWLILWRQLFVSLVIRKRVSVLWQEEGYAMKYSLNQREILTAKPEGFTEGAGYISLYFLTQITIQTFSLTTSALTFLGEQYWRSWFSLLLRQLGNMGKYCPVDWAILES